ADRRLKLGAPTPAAAPMPTAPDSSSHEVSTSPYGTAAGFAKSAIKPREHETTKVPPLPTSTASEGSSPATRASPPGPSAETAVAQPGGRLIVLRAPNFGWNFALNLKIDGRTAANIVQGRRYDDFVPAGRHMLTVSATPNLRNQPTSTVLNVQDGQTYVFTAIRQNTDSVVLVPSALPPGQPQ